MNNQRQQKCQGLEPREPRGATSDETTQKWSPGGLAPGFRSPGWERFRFSTSGRKRELARMFREVKMIFS